MDKLTEDQVVNYLMKWLSDQGWTIDDFCLGHAKGIDISASKGKEVLLNHETIHLKQQLELLIIPFYLWYGIEFIIRYFQYKSWDLAYRNISFEREAYANEKDFDYLKKRKFCGFWKFIKISLVK